jgi:hypothetical protein
MRSQNLTSRFLKPRLAFVDSFYSLLSAAHVNPHFIFYPLSLHLCVQNVSAKHFRNTAYLICTSNWLFKVFSLIFSYLPLTSFISACRFRYNSSPSVTYLSDGQLTQILISRKLLPADRFVQISDVSNTLSSSSTKLSVNSSLEIIIGSNWVEFGCMTLASYKLYLQQLSAKYPGYQYKPHPDEDHYYPSQYFTILDSLTPLELYVLETGIPARVVTTGSSASFFLSSSISSMGLVNCTHFYCISNIKDYCDGPRGNITGSFIRNGNCHQVNTSDLFKCTIADLDRNGIHYTLCEI